MSKAKSRNSDPSRKYVKKYILDTVKFYKYDYSRTRPRAFLALYRLIIAAFIILITFYRVSA